MLPETASIGSKLNDHFHGFRGQDSGALAVNPTGGRNTFVTSITIPLPEDLAERLAELPEDERQAFAVAALRDAVTERDLAATLTDADHAAVAEGLADLDAGRVRPAASVFDDLFARHGGSGSAGPGTE